MNLRLFPPYSIKVADRVKAARTEPTKWGRMAIMSAVDNGLFGLTEKLTRIEDELIRLRRDFNDAVQSEDD